MARARISTTVDAALLDNARRSRASITDAELIDEALTVLLARDAPLRSMPPTRPPMPSIHSTNPTNGEIWRRSVKPPADE